MNFTATQIKELDEITAKFTMFKDFNSLLDSYHFHHPSFDVSKPDLRKLANAYDKVQEARKSAFRAHRYYFLKSNKIDE